jgi:hypothetical protein
MLFLDEYRSASNVFSMPTFVPLILRENGTYLKTLLYGEEHVTSHNAIFAVVLHTDHNDTWVTSNMKYQVTICYDMRYLRLERGSVEYEHFINVFQQILQCKVTLLGFSSFERALGLYPTLLNMLLSEADGERNEYCCLFRRETSSMVDMHLHLVMQCFLRRRPADFVGAPWHCEVTQNWCDFFNDTKQLYWYHDYVMLVVAAEARDGYSIANVEAASHDLTCTEPSTTNEELARTRAKQSLLKLLAKAYKYSF